jgi:hypothetical protein
MKDCEISTPDQLDAALVKNAMDKQRKLWRATEGHYSWLTLAVMVCAAALLLFGMIAGGDSEGDRLFSVGLGIFMFLQFQIYSVQAQKKAITDLLKRLEQRVTRLEQKTYSD